MKKVSILSLGFLVFGVIICCYFASGAGFAILPRYTNDHPLILAPGEEIVFPIRLVNGLNDRDIKVKAALLEGEEIASFVDDNLEYTLPKPEKVPVNVRVRVPRDAAMGSEYTLIFQFIDITPTEGAETVPLSVSSEVSFKVLVQEPVEKEGMWMGWWIVIIGVLIILIGIVVYFILRNRFYLFALFMIFLLMGMFFSGFVSAKEKLDVSVEVLDKPVEKGDIVEITAEQFKEQRARVISVDEEEGEAEITLLDVAVPNVVIVDLDNLKVIGRETETEVSTLRFDNFNLLVILLPVVALMIVFIISVIFRKKGKEKKKEKKKEKGKRKEKKARKKRKKRISKEELKKFRIEVLKKARAVRKEKQRKERKEKKNKKNK